MVCGMCFWEAALRKLRVSFVIAGMFRRRVGMLYVMNLVRILEMNSFGFIPFFRIEKASILMSSVFRLGEDGETSVPDWGFAIFILVSFRHISQM